MQTIVIIIHLLVVIALVTVVLIQHSEGGGFGSSSGSGLMTVRGAKNTMTRLTAILAGCFFLTSIILTVLQAIPKQEGQGILDQIPSIEERDSVGNSVSSDNLLDQLGAPAHKDMPAQPVAPTSPAQGETSSGQNKPLPEKSAAPEQAVDTIPQVEIPN